MNRIVFPLSSCGIFKPSNVIMYDGVWLSMYLINFNIKILNLLANNY